MSSPSDRFVQRWLDAALIDSHTAERIRAWELEHDAPGSQHRIAAIAWSRCLMRTAVIGFEERRTAVPRVGF